MPNALALDGSPLSIADLVSVARDARPVELAPSARTAMRAARAVVDRAAAGSTAVYGVNTGFGSLARVRIEPDQLRALQHNLLRSHAAGVGEPLAHDVVRAMMTLLAASLARGRSGVREVLVEQILRFLAHDLVPVVPSRGSVGASGDLAPLAHLALPLTGEGELWHDGRRVPAAEAMRAAGVEPLGLEAKEGLALINGTHFMAAAGALAAHDIARLLDWSIAAAAMAIDACRASHGPLDPRIHDARTQPGQVEVARRLRDLLDGSAIVTGHRENDPRVQDPYCLRATPQVLGAALDAARQARATIETELGAVTDNPLVFTDPGGAEGDGEIVSGGNFHGMPCAISLDLAKIALCHVAGISERRVFWILSGHDPETHVHPYLSAKPGLNSGLMIAQYTAAACCNEMRVLATPASVGNVSTSAGIEDYNSMGATSANHLLQVVDLVRSVIAIELVTMAEALEFQRPECSGAGVESLHARIRELVPRLTDDRSPAPDIERVRVLIATSDVG